MLKASITSMVSAIVDFGVSLATFASSLCSSGVAASFGAISGGIVNCTMNYQWTFRHSESQLRCVVTKYVLVWVGSLLLNTFGTMLMTNLLLSCPLLDLLDISRNMRFSIARLLVSGAVSIFWNLRLQHDFVFRKVAADSHITRLFHRFNRNPSE